MKTNIFKPKSPDEFIENATINPKPNKEEIKKELYRMLAAAYDAGIHHKYNSFPTFKDYQKYIDK